MRLAWFTPLAPAASGIASYSAMVLPRLAAAHGIDVFVDDQVWRARRGDAVAMPDGLVALPSPLGTIRSAHDFQPLHLAAAYELVVYQMGNAACHDYMWPYAVRYPGLLVLHDAQLHQSRAGNLLRQGRRTDYAAELAWCHADAPPALADWGISGLANAGAPVWPLTATLIRTARTVAVHFPRLAADLREAHPEVAVDVIRHGSPDLLATASPDAPPADRPIVLAAFGLVTPEKRVPQILRALAAVRQVVPPVRLRLVGGTVGYYDVRADAEAVGVADLVEVTGYTTDADFDRHLVEADVCLSLRWPTNREASGPWLRALSAGKATIVNDLVHLVDLPTLDPRTWEVQVAPRSAAEALRRPPIAEAVAVAIDILDEDHSLALALRRLIRDPALRASLGAAARRLWARDHTVEAMVDDYTRVIASAAAAPVPQAVRGTLPPHLLADGTATLRRLADDCGIAVDWIG